MKRLLSAVLYGSLLAAPSLARADGEFKSLDKVKGEAPINGNPAQARKDALEDAFRNACMQAAGTNLDAATRVEGGALVSDKIFSHVNGYIKSFEIASDEDTGKGTWEVLLHPVVVGVGQLDKDVAAVRAQIAHQGHPRIYALIREQSFEAGEAGIPALQLSQGLVEQGLQARMTGLGWKFVDPQVAAGKVHVENAATADFAALNGKDFATTGADYVLLGSVVVRPMKVPNTLVPDADEVRAVVNIKSTDTGETVASVQYSEKVLTTEGNLQRMAVVAMNLAVTEIEKTLSKQVLEVFRARTMGTGNVHVYVSTPDYETFTALEELLPKALPAVKNVTEVGFTDGKGDLSIDLTGTSTKAIASALSGKTVKGQPIKITKVSASTVEVKVGK
jgi:hypothetical protein